MRHVFSAALESGEQLEDTAGNLPPRPGTFFPDYTAPILRAGTRGWRLMAPARGCRPRRSSWWASAPIRA